MKGRIFSIEEFGIFDGDGIRTTVFLKGCPLRCSWCHSPEGQSYEKQYLRSPNGCLGCGRCLDAGERATGRRVLCDESIAACPRNLVRLCGEDVESDELASKLLKNSDILARSGGGVTFSGGEPLMQYDFLSEMLTVLEGKVHRAIQTTGYTDCARFAEITRKTDLILYDLKVMNRDAHKRYTGVYNDVILENYKFLAAGKTRFITRVPLIPGVSDTDENIDALCAFMRRSGVFYVELLPYNKYAGSKYKMCGREYKPDFDETVPVRINIEKFEKYGIKAIKL
jgi:glycyl-radical enzyme activating protein family protein